MLNDPLPRGNKKFKEIEEPKTLYKENFQENARDKKILGSEDRNFEMERLADRALLLLSFKETSTPNLRYIMKVLGIQTLEEKKIILQIIYELIRDGLAVIPRGFSNLVKPDLDWKNAEEIENIDLCLLKPYDEIIKELQKQIMELQEQLYNLH
ncbi:MAG: hypothetical protein EAX86_05535 [Candidatus Heimdallarchaeota archaeon]|nr:hypothetical protein [Candidatus Heimdallarchaeota archaeon]